MSVKKENPEGVHNMRSTAGKVLRRKPTLAEPFPAVTETWAPKRGLSRDNPRVREKMGLAFDLII